MSSSSTVQNIHPLPFDEAISYNADVIILGDSHDEDGARYENILMEIRNYVGTNNIVFLSLK